MVKKMAKVVRSHGNNQPKISCGVTGIVSEKNVRLADGNIILSPEGTTTDSRDSIQKIR